jgi:FMN phosphatase YigB (HAD superfamily)
MLDDLIEMNCALGLVTDCVYDVPAVWAETDFFMYFSAAHYSCVTHIRKPDARAYKGVLDLLETPVQEALFVGDGGSDELNGAVRVGMDAVMISDLTPESGEVMRVGVVDWDGAEVHSMSEIANYVRNSE